jgi:O-antigen/teichoic acid export membrane protein
MRSPSMPARAGRWVAQRLDREAGARALVSNAGSLFGTTVVTTGFGAVYWALAARLFSTSAIGLSAALISSMTLVGRVATVGLGTVLMGELSHQPGNERRLVFVALGISGVVGAVTGALFLVFAGVVAPELSAFANPLGILLFAVGVAGTAAGFVLDQAFIGLLRGGLQLVRNVLASVAKLVALILAGVLAATGADVVFATWVIGTTVSMVLIPFVPRPTRRGADASLWRLPPGLGQLAVRHHLLNLSILAPSLLLPVVVTAVLSSEANGYFYIAYTIASLALAVPAALAMALYATGARDLTALRSHARLAFGLSVAAGLVINVVIFFGAGPLLSIFGPQYATQGTSLLRLLTLGIFPVAISSVYVPIARLERKFLLGTALMLIGTLVEFACVIVGARLGGLTGLGAGWLVGLSLATVPLLPTVLRVMVTGTLEPVVEDALGPVLNSSPDQRSPGERS